MRRLFLVLLSVTLSGVGQAGTPPATPYTVIARVDSFEKYRASSRSERFSLATPYGSDTTIVATIVQPESLAGREIAVPFESKKSGTELLVQPGTLFRFEYHANLLELRNRTDRVRRRTIPFPLHGVIVLKPGGEVAELYRGVLSSRLVAELQKEMPPTAR